jgi:hypothetical protein
MKSYFSAEDKERLLAKAIAAADWMDAKWLLLLGTNDNIKLAI